VEPVVASEPGRRYGRLEKNSVVANVVRVLVDGKKREERGSSLSIATGF